MLNLSSKKEIENLKFEKTRLEIKISKLEKEVGDFLHFADSYTINWSMVIDNNNLCYYSAIVIVTINE